MTDEDDSTDRGIIAAERAILKFLRGRKANDAAREDRGTSAVNQLAQHPAPANPVKQTKTIEELAAMIDRLRSQPMEFSADFWRRRRLHSQQN